MADVFISYKRDERAAIEHLAETLRGLGLSVWFDASLTAGESFSEEIDREARSAKAILVCWSPTARESRWVRAEAMIGFEHDRLAACYVAGPDNFSPPAPFNSIHAEDLRAWLAAPSEAHGGWKSVLRRIGKLCGRADVEAWGALDSQANPAELRGWIAKHGDSPLREAAEALLHQREQHFAERAAREQAERDRRAKEKQSQKKAARSRVLKVLRPWLVGAGVLAAAASAYAVYALAPFSAERPIGPPGRYTVAFSDPAIAARVHGLAVHTIYYSEVQDHAVARGYLAENEEAAPGSDAFHFALEELIQTPLFAIEAEQRGLDRQPEIVRQLRGTTRQSPYWSRVLANAMYEELDRAARDPANAERLYRENAARLGEGAEIHLAHIQFQTQEAAEAALRRLSAGERFEALAFELSTDRGSAPDGGDLGFRLESDLTPVVRDAIANVVTGGNVGPIQIESNWHVFRVVDRRTSGATPSLEELRPRIEDWLRYQATTELQERLERDYRVEVSPVVAAGEAAVGAPENPVGPGGVSGQ